MKTNLDYIWTLVAGILVFLMQPGFMAIEAGLVRSKNSINVAIKNFIDFVISSMTFWAFGAALMFGVTFMGFIGTDGFFLSRTLTEGAFNPSFWFFQVVFAGTAATIVSGAIAERTKFSAYMIISFFVSGLVYPVFGHWAWGNLLNSNQEVWLSQLGFMDFAGSTVVHSIGGWTGLIGAIIIGPRLGKYNSDGSSNKISAHNLILATLGAFLLWLGWFGFNGGSTNQGNPDVGLIITNTNLAAAAGAFTALMLIWIRERKPVIDYVINGALAGLVSITANCNYVSPTNAVIIGAIGGVLVDISVLFIDKVLKIDDPVGAVSVHGTCGVWGTLAVALFIPEKNLATGDWLNQLGIQALGSVIAFVWSMGLGLIIFWLIKKTMGVRPSKDDEMNGLNFSEHGARNILSDTASTMNNIAESKDLTQRIDASIGDDTGEIGTRFNHFLNWLHDIVFQFRDFSDKITNNTQALLSRARKTEKIIDDMVNSMEDVDNKTAEHTKIIEITSSRLESIISTINHLTGNLQNQLSHVIQSTSAIDQVTSSINIVADMAARASTISNNLEIIAESGAQDIRQQLKAIQDIKQSSHEIVDIVSIIDTISTKTNLLAMNAAIEAAHAGVAGKGFAVVSAEIRKLALMTTDSAKSIGAILNTIISKIDHATQTAEKTEEILNTILNDIHETSHINKQIALATHEQFTSSNEILDSVHSLNSITHGIQNSLNQQNDDSQKIAHTIQELLDIANNIKEAISKQVVSSYRVLKAVIELGSSTEHNDSIARELGHMTNKFTISERLSSS